MKALSFLVPFSLILIVSLVKCEIETLPFINGKNIYWLTLVILTAIAFVMKKENKALKINTYDFIVLTLVFLGLINFVFLSRATVYTISIWQYTGYLTIYLLLRGFCVTTELNKKTLNLLLYFCILTAVINVFWMFMQWNSWIYSPNQFFKLSGLFFSPNHSGIFLSIGFLSTLFLLQKKNSLVIKIGLTLALIIIFSGLIISQSRGAIISLIIALTYFFYQSKIKTKQYWNWKTYLAIGIFLIGSIYYITVINKNKTDSTSGRYFTTQQILKQISQQPFGHGLNSFSVEYNKGKAQYFENNQNWEEMKNAGYLFYANNDFLELTFELGIHWIIIFIIFIFLIYRTRHTTIEILICKTLMLCFIIFSLTNSILTGPVFIIIAIATLSLYINTSNSKTLYEFKNNIAYKTTTIGLLILALFIQINRINAETNLYRLYKGNKFLKGENQLKAYTSKIEEKGEEYFISGIVLLKNGYKKEGITYLHTGFKRSGKPSLGKILANGLEKEKNYTLVEKIYAYNKNVEPYRYEARMDLFHLYLKTSQIEKGKNMALEIVNLPIKIPSLKITQYKKEAKEFLKE